MKQFKKTLSILLVIMTVLTICSTAMPVFAAGDLFSNKTFVAESYVQQEMTSKIVGEVSELREEYAKHFVCEDGSYVVATYTEPVHYKENGKWKEIDNSLKLNSEVKSCFGKSMYAPKAGPADVSIPQSFSNDQKISATNKGHTISFGVSQGMNVRLNKSATVVSDVEDLTSNMSTSNVAMLQKTMTASTALASKESKITAYNNEVMAVENQSGAIVYEDIFNNADLEYIVTTNSIKENIVVQKKQYDYTYSFDMDFGELVPIVNEDNSIRVVDPETEETVFFVAAPYMYDANGIESTDIDLTLVEEDGIYVLSLKASADWINASERVLPVVIDPTVYMSYNDVYVMSGIVNQNNTKLNNEIRIGKNLTNSTRTYIKPEIPTNIPAGSYINNAQLILQKDYYFQFVGASDIYAYAFDCYKIASWDPSTITWKNQPVDNSKNGYANCDLEFLSSVEATSGRTEYPFDITNAVRRWFAGGRNNGIMLASSNESTTTQVDFYSSRAKDSSTYPQIYITYTAPSVSIPRWETDSRAKESSAFTITTSSNWTISSNASWISLSTTSGSGIGSSKIIITENTSIFDRVGTVTVKMGSTVIGTITVTQFGADPYLTVSSASLNFDVGSSKQKVNITSNTAWSFSNLPEWITVTPSEGSMNSAVEVEVSVNNNAVARESNISVTADTVTKTINIAQLNDTEAPAKPDIYEEDGLVYISSRTFDFDKGTETEEHIEYKLGSGEWTDYEDEPLSVIRTYDATIYARVCDKSGNASEVVSLVLESDLGEYTASYTDIALGEGLFPVEFGRTYTSTNGWFFTFDANIVKIDDNSYVFTDFYGEKQYFIKNGKGKYLSVDEEELMVNADSYVLTYGDMTCTFDLDGKINRIVTDYLDMVYTWGDNLLTITGGATVAFTDGKPTNITITRTDSEDISHTKEVNYVWTDSNLTRFIDAADVEHNYVYTNGLLTTNETETITYSAEGRVKLISQPNGAFVKYTYNDSAENSEVSNNIGAVTVSDSKGVTDTHYYADGVYITSTIGHYSENAVYAPRNISETLTQDNTADILYVVEYMKDELYDNSDGDVPAVKQDGEIKGDDENSPEMGGVDNNCTDENTMPLYKELDEKTYAFYYYDGQQRVSIELLVLKTKIPDITTATFESVDEVAHTEIIYVYANEKDNAITDKYVFSYTDDCKLQTEEHYYPINNDFFCVSKFTYDSNENIVLEQYFRQEMETETTINVEYKNCIREYFKNGNIKIETQKTLVDGVLTSTKELSYAYDEEDQLTNYIVKEYLLGDLRMVSREMYSYNDFGNIMSETTSESSYYIDPDTNTVKDTELEVITEYIYDIWNQQEKITVKKNDKVCSTTKFAYDDIGNVVLVEEDGVTVEYEYADGNVSKTTETKEIQQIGETQTAKTVINDYVYSNGNLIKRINTTKVGEVVSDTTVAIYTYDFYGNLMTHNFNDYHFTYNTLGSILSVNAAAKLCENEEGINPVIDIVSYTYSNDVKQNVLTSNFGNGQSIVYDYNEDGEITAIKLGEETKYGYEYLETTDDNDEVTKEWTELTDYVNSLKKTIEAGKTTVKDLNGNFIYSVENVVKDEDIADSFDGVITKIGGTVYSLVTEENKDIFKTNSTTDFTKEYTYVNEELSKIKTAGITTSCSYDVDKLLFVLENTLNDISQVYGYTYDENGNITTETLTITTKQNNEATVESNETIHYTYDDKEQLISAETSTVKYEYTYDGRGNILSKKEYLISLDGNNQKVYNLVENSIDTYIYDEFWKDKLISYNGLSITYDVVGNPTNYMGNTLTWTMGRQLASFGDISYTYNEDGIRTSKTANNITTTYYLDGTNIIEQTDGRNTLHFYYDSNDEVIGFTYNEVNYFYVKNSMGDIVGIADIYGNLIASYTYDSWGKVISVSGVDTTIAELNPFRYRSYYYDSDIQMYYLQSRYYDPEIARFINSDDVNYIGASGTVNSYNPFVYCENNAIVYSDPSGSISIYTICINFKNIILKFFNKNTLANYFKKIYGSKKFGESPVKISISGNTIKISITFKFSGDLKDMRFQNQSYYKTYQRIFLDGVEEFWSGNFKVFGYDVELETDAKTSKNSGIDVEMLDENGVPHTSWHGSWKIGNYGDIFMYKCRDSHFYSADDFEYVAAHEVGHILGVDDIYTKEEYANIVMSIFNVFGTRVQDLDVEMVLLAFATNSLITYDIWLDKRVKEI